MTLFRDPARFQPTRHSLCILLFAVLSPWLGAQAVQVGSIADARFGTGYGLDGGQLVEAREKLLSPNNFGPGGTVTASIEITDTGLEVNSVTEELLSAFDVFFVGWLNDESANAFTESELNAFESWIEAGGVLIATCDDTGHDAICAHFGQPISNGIMNPSLPTDPDHPAFSGPFGTVSQILSDGNQGHFENVEEVTVLAEDSAEPPRATVITKEMGEGRFIFIGDVCILADEVTPGSGISNNNDRFLGNLFTFAGGQMLWAVFSQIGNGEGVTSAVVLANPSDSDSAKGRIDLFGDQADDLAAGFDSLEFEIPPRGVRTISSSGEGALLAGAARIIANHRVDGVVRFSIPGVGIAGVGSSQPLSNFLIPVRRMAGGINTGIALHQVVLPQGLIVVGLNTSVTATLRDEDGVFVAETEIHLPPGGTRPSLSTVCLQRLRPMTSREVSSSLSKAAGRWRESPWN